MNLEPIRALLELAQEIQDGLDMIPDSGLTISSDEAFTIAASAPVLSQLLEAVTNLEKLEAEWRDYRETGISRDGENYADGYNESLDDCADDLKRLLHPEDK